MIKLKYDDLSALTNEVPERMIENQELPTNLIMPIKYPQLENLS